MGVAIPIQEGGKAMNAYVEACFVETALALGLSEQRADCLARAANGDSMARIHADTGIPRPSVTFARAYKVLGANHRAHAVAIIFTKVLQNMLDTSGAGGRIRTVDN